MQSSSFPECMCRAVNGTRRHHSYFEPPRDVVSARLEVASPSCIHWTTTGRDFRQVGGRVRKWRAPGRHRMHPHHLLLESFQCVDSARLEVVCANGEHLATPAATLPLGDDAPMRSALHPTGQSVLLALGNGGLQRIEVRPSAEPQAPPDVYVEDGEILCLLPSLWLYNPIWLSSRSHVSLLCPRTHRWCMSCMAPFSGESASANDGCRGSAIGPASGPA